MTAMSDVTLPPRSERKPATSTPRELSHEAAVAYALQAAYALEALRAIAAHSGSITFGTAETVATPPSLPDTTTPRAFSTTDSVVVREPSVELILARAEKRIRDGRIDAAFDALFASIDDFAAAKDFDSLNAVLAHASTMPDAPLKLLVGLLTITLPLRGRLRDRRTLVSRVRVLAERIGGKPKADAVLSGLDE